MFGIPYEADLTSRALKAPPKDSEDIVVLAWEESAAFAMGIVSLAPQGALLATAATVESARHRGGYRAVVAARCQVAEDRGLDWVVAQAGAQSRPILEGMGFAQIGWIDLLVDRF